MKVAIVGSRRFGDSHAVRQFVRDLGPEVEIVSGGAVGVDSVAEAAARTYGNPVKIFPADWSKGKSAGFARNHDIVAYADIVVAFWDGQSPGTRHTIGVAKAAGKHVEVIRAGELGTVIAT